MKKETRRKHPSEDPSRAVNVTSSRAEKIKPAPAADALKGRLLPLAKDSFEPLYFQIQAQFEQLIREGYFQVDDPLPGEAELSRIFGVSRMTSRQALQGMETNGFAYRERGRGTFVRAPKVEKHIAHLLGFTAEMALLGLRASTQLLAKGESAASPPIANDLRIAVGSRVMVLRRLRLANQEPVAIENIYIPLARFPNIDTIDFAKNSLYETLRRRYDVSVGSAQETLEARGASRKEAKLLQIRFGASLLVITRTLLDVYGNPIEAGESLYRGDRYRAVLTVPATEPDAVVLQVNRRGY